MEQLVAVESQPELSNLVEEVRRSGQPLVITRSGEKQAALIDIEILNRLMEEQRLERQVDAMLTRLAERNRAFSDEEVEVDVALAVAEARAALAEGSH